MKCFTAVTAKHEFHRYAQLLTEEQIVNLADFRHLEISGISQTKVYDKSLSCLRKRLVDQQILSGRWMELEQFYK